MFGNKFPIELPGAGFEQFLEGGTDRAFVSHPRFFQLLEVLVIGGHAFVRCLRVSVAIECVD